MLLSNVFREYVDNYKQKDNEDPEEFKKIIDNVENEYIKGNLSQYDYRKILNDLGSSCVIV